ncbi:3-dehydroquinate synthase [Bacillus sp. FJAT-42376]|uniref:3-dehydroquinate synthase n=1 Tax=Bacillus sp. FJAT-42376 TaxID=2014076 RepID=UPI000F502028|nr:3-dehydroquinate synthase [Bacillus sp. FJAT-42376]AZB43335.1 3-dehydroquinate synthase [Bacillus sp. FJAT-42376]
MEAVTVASADHSYQVIIGNGALSSFKHVLTDSGIKPEKILLITDDEVYRLYGEKVKASLCEYAPVEVMAVPNGEEAKSFEQYYAILSYALEIGLDRKSMIAALGGGVVGDLAGFAAATFMRGIPFIQIPTTLLAHDSAVGGKTGINHPKGKNMIGAFHQPKAVFYHPEFLASLPDREMRSGMAEVIKHALIANPSFLSWLQKDLTAVRSPNEEQLIKMITEGIRVKAAIVSEDEKETGVRAFLNFGHTLGHAIEAALGYGKITHGDAVAQGMLFASWLSEKELGSSIYYTEHKMWFKEIGFPVAIPEKVRTEELVSYMLKDKKSASGNVNMVLLEEIGSPVIHSFLPVRLQELLEQYRKEELN